MKSGTRGKRGRGRPPKAAPPSPVSQPTPLSSENKQSTSEMENPDFLSSDTSRTRKEEEQETVLVEDKDEDSETLIEGKSKKAPQTEPKKIEERKLWVDVLAENRNLAKGLSMQYVAPTVTSEGIEIEIEEDDIASEVQYWETTLILYAMGEELSMNMVKNFMEKTWSFVKLPDMFYHDEGYFILQFKSHEDMDAVLMRGPYTLRNISLMLREWKADFNLKRDMLRTLPLWVKLPKLPLHLWGAKSLSKIGSAIGVPLVTDECTTTKLRVSYARLLIEVDITKEMVKEIAIKDCEGGN
ncbi:uncharacterized protein LOC131619814 [Vicia villosa]|uniref:uncharacterized protein LOC131619814 n=1 Tax=Vicia villosa TaxID=3911 RepID=UPI00273CB761|nr:uncharacterized protein LOC131619814 [Vicia villosa]